MNRRKTLHILLNSAAPLTAGSLAGCWAQAASQRNSPLYAARFEALAHRIETTLNVRLGVALLDTGTNALFGHRLDERFPLCSTFKLAAAALVLHRVDTGHEQLNRSVVFGLADQVPYGPVTEPRLPHGQLSVGELCEAIVTVSDNTAANLLLRSFGGPAALTAWLRSMGDASTRLDRMEPELNTALAGDPRDTTTPRAMAATLRRIVLGDALKPASREQLVRWMRASPTGNGKLKAGLPAGWHLAGRTGAGAYGTSNDMAVLWPPAGAPLVVCAYLTQTKAQAQAKDAALADIGALACLLRA